MTPFVTPYPSPFLPTRVQPFKVWPSKRLSKPVSRCGMVLQPQRRPASANADKAVKRIAHCVLRKGFGEACFMLVRPEDFAISRALSRPRKSCLSSMERMTLFKFLIAVGQVDKIYEVWQTKNLLNWKAPSQRCCRGQCFVCGWTINTKYWRIFRAKCASISCG